MLERAGALRIKVSLSTYNGWRINNNSHMLGFEDLPALRQVLNSVKALKQRRNNMTSGEYYLDRIPEYFQHQGIPKCTAGLNWVQVTPDDMIKRCSDQPVACHWSQWRPGLLEPTDCERCWYSCRGAAQEPWTWRRLVEMSREALS